jgi:hypothetical protein
MSRCVWGFIHAPKGTLAAYFVHWTLTRVADHGANFDLIIGRWGEGTTAADRAVVSLAYRLDENGPSLMVIDANDRPAASGGLAARALRRTEVVGRPISQEAFVIVDAILAQDDRVAELMGPRRMA